MIARPTRTATLDGVARCGTLLVIALVVALPLTLALCPASALDGGTASGAGAGTGDVLAAALSSLDRDLHGTRLLPAPARCETPAAMHVTPIHPTDRGTLAFDATAPPIGSREDTPGDARPGPTGLGHQLRR